MNIAVIKLGTVCRDSATKLQGTLTHWQIDMSRRIDYVFQPKGLNPEDGQPIKRIYAEAERLTLPENAYEGVDVPFEILGSNVTDKASGFTGMAVGFTRHINGCFHVVIQPTGIIPKTGQVIQKAEFDLRGCEGEKIPVMTEAARTESERKQPSPCELPERH